MSVFFTLSGDDVALVVDREAPMGLSAPRPTPSNRSAAWANSSTGIICGVRIRRSAGEHRMRLISASPGLQRQRRDTMPVRCCEFVDSRLRRSPPDRASAVPYRQAGENAMRFPHLAHRSAAAHKLHSTTATTRYEFASGEGEIFSRQSALAYSPRKLSKQPGPSHSAVSLFSRGGLRLRLWDRNIAIQLQI